MPPLSVCDTNISIRNNRYSLNDLHKAAGSEDKQRPSFFLRNEQTKALIAEIEQSANLQSDQCADLHSAAVETINGGRIAGRSFVGNWCMRMRCGSAPSLTWR
jgi:hypothetical protein